MLVGLGGHHGLPGRHVGQQIILGPRCRAWLEDLSSDWRLGGEMLRLLVRRREVRGGRAEVVVLAGNTNHGAKDPSFALPRFPLQDLTRPVDDHNLVLRLQLVGLAGMMIGRWLFRLLQSRSEATFLFLLELRLDGSLGLRLQVNTTARRLGNTLGNRCLSVALTTGLLLSHNPVLLVVLRYGQFLGPVLSLTVEVEVAVGCAPETTKLTLKRFELLVDCAAVVLQLGGNEKHFATEITGEGLVSHMNHLYVNF